MHSPPIDLQGTCLRSQFPVNYFLCYCSDKIAKFLTKAIIPEMHVEVKAAKIIKTIVRRKGIALILLL